MRMDRLKYSLFSLVLFVFSCSEEHDCAVKTIETNVQEKTVSVHISAQSTSELVQYNWHFSDGYSKATIVPYTEYEMTSVGSQIVEVEVEDSEGRLCYYEAGFFIQDNFTEDTCDVDISFFQLNENYLEANVEVGGESNNIQYTWETGDGYELKTESADFDYEYENAGTYHFKVIYENGECLDSTTKVINIEKDLTSDCEEEIIFEGYPYILGGEVVFVASTSDPNLAVKYTWNMGDGSPIKFSYGPSFEHNYSTPGIYTVNVTLELGDCVVEETFDIEVI